MYNVITLRNDDDQTAHENLVTYLNRNQIKKNEIIDINKTVGKDGENEITLTYEVNHQNNVSSKNIVKGIIVAAALIICLILVKHFLVEAEIPYVAAY